MLLAPDGICRAYHKRGLLERCFNTGLVETDLSFCCDVVRSASSVKLINYFNFNYLRSIVLCELILFSYTKGLPGVQYLESATIFQFYVSLKLRLQKPYLHRQFDKAPSKVAACL